jgi:hypothetical protein
MHARERVHANVSLPFNIISSSTTTLSINDIQAGFIAASYTTPNGNNPSAYSNNLFVWPGGPDVSWGQAAIATATAPFGGTSIAGSYSAQPYVVGYSVGPSMVSQGVTSYPNVCATAAIPPNWDVNQVTYFSPGIGITTVQTTLISFTYSLPPGFNPNGAGSWIGLWFGNVTPYNLPPLASAPVTQTTSSGSAPMTGLGITPNGIYTAALFTSGYSSNPANLSLTTIAAAVVFQTQSKLG